MTALPVDVTPLIAAAKLWHDAGYTVVPSHEDGGKRPFAAWKQYQHERPTWEQLEAWLLSGRYSGIGVITGAASGGVEMIEIEGPAEAAALRFQSVLEQANALGPDAVNLLVRVHQGCVETSAGGGTHVFVRVTDGPVPGNTKLASDGGKVVAETRGEGGFVIVAPTTARKGHAPGAVYAFTGGCRPHMTASVTVEELECLHMLHTMALGTDDDIPPVPPAPVVARVAAPSTGLSAFDDYRARVSWREILEPLGWTWSHRSGERDHWTRPGKHVSEGTSATTIEDGPLHCFSSSVPGIAPDTSLSKGQFYAAIHHGGDLSAAARDLAAQGYGDPSPAYPELATWTPQAAIADELWEAHPTLAKIRQAAHARMVSADAVLACVLARVVQAIPYMYALPPIIGGRAAPNMFVALIGESGTGKGAARRTADELLGSFRPADPLNEGPLGSGEGIVGLFYGSPPSDDPDAKPRKEELYYRGVLILDEEGSALAELLQRQGQVTEQVLLKMWSGERLGFTYSKRSGPVLVVPDMQYRAAALLGIQPAAAAFLLDRSRADRGLPQRFLWASTVDPTIPLDGPPFPGRIDWTPPTFGRGFHSDEIAVDEAIRDELRRVHHARMTDQGTGQLESHGGLVRLKAAVAIAALLRPSEPLAVDLEDWRLAGMLKDASDRVRDAVASKARREAEAKQQARQEQAVRQRVAVEQAGDQVRNVARVIARHVAKAHADEDSYCIPSCARKAVKSRDRLLFDAAIEKALDLEWLVDNTTDDGEARHFGVGPSRPS